MSFQQESQARLEATATGEHAAGHDSAAQQVEEMDNPQKQSQGVNVEQAKRIFDDMESQLNEEEGNDGSGTSSSLEMADLEKQESKHVGQFNLRDWVANFQEESYKAGSKRKQLGASWNEVTVLGTSSMDLKVPTIPSMALFEVIGPIFGILKTFGINLPKQKSRKLLTGFTGSAKPGEMVLVLGRPGAGCSTFLKTIANKRNGFIGVEGDVHYGGIDAKEMDKRYMGQLIYSEEDDVHNATLTVSQTIDFALRVKATSKLLPEHSRKTYRKLVRDTLLKMFDVEHTKHTLVGSATVRGVSGGERKRVSIMEVLTTGATLIGWDNTSRGLDASTALDYAKSMRILTDITQTTMFVSLYQASESIWQQFDKIMVINDGHCVYFGPRTEAREYFHSLGFGDRPRQTSADYVTGMTDKYERIFQEGRDETNVPCTPEEQEAAYRKSDIYKRVLEEKEAYDLAVKEDQKANAIEFKEAVSAEKHPGVRHRSQYTVPFWEQIWALVLRSMQMKAGDRFDIFMSYVTAIVLALLVGGLFFEMPKTSAGIFIRGGALFIMLLFSSLTAFAEMPTQMLGRPILARQAGYAFYRPAAQLIASLIADMPFGIPRSTIFVIIVYFMSGLHRSAGAFFTAWLIVLVSYYVFRCLFTLFGVVTRNFYTAARLAAIVMTVLVLWAGYVIPQFTMARWLFWICYINPVFYAFEGVMINEFKRTIFTCADAQVIPSGGNYPAGIGANQVCTLAGSTPGSPLIPGQDYLDANFRYYESHLWRNVGILFAFLAGLTAITCFVVEVQDQGAFASAMTVKKPPSKEEKKLDDRLADRRSGATEMTEAKLEVLGQNFTWQNLKYTVPVKGGKRLLLDSVDGYVKNGSLTALMGASGAGKTTLLDVLADRKTIGVIEGDRLIEGRKIDNSFQRQCGYAEQQDIHEPMCSVREALRFSAYLRQPYGVPQAEKDAYVEDIIELLELHDLADAIIGYPGFGLGVGDRKRVTIGVELAAKPEMLLFLDEPTSGLDGQSAFTICRLLRKLANNGQTILCTIHQPSALLFETFDRLLLLERGGKTVYFGPVGKDGKHIIDYFAQRGAQCPPGINMAEYMLDAIGAGSQPRVGDRDWADWYLDSDLYKENLQTIAHLNEQGVKKPVAEGRKSQYAAPWSYQFTVTLKRTLLSTWRQPSYQYTRLVQHFVFALLTGLLFLQLSNSYVTLQYRIFAIFMLAIIPAIIMAQIQPFWIQSRSIWIREETSKTFDGTVFAATQLISEVPYALVCATFFFIPLYYLVGFNNGLVDASDSNRAGVFWVIVFIVELFAITLGSLISSFCANAYLASLFVPFLIVIMSLTCGVLSPPNQMSSTLYSQFFYNVNPIRFAISTLVPDVMHNLPVQCAESELTRFTPPSGQTCQEWAGAYLSRAGGYLADPNSTTSCGYCPVKNGDEFYAAFGMNFDERGRNIGILIAFTVFNAIGTIFFTKYLHFSNR
ncbi:putative ATP-binding multidrug cassette transport protein [Meira miltonrushii]|uniref:Putative ATP-binding multidrug cassette transport protein n=1 Tax=Meira miltonrushii TaxID=1280837 RepID=A0A316V996_9BASI|nr:putative ATP-binding multidrug cassette transport protein [Meira miltonrushii]PWN34157.1 putative ATP-binding multidrug cassette transport protein [Meira miltonrushii]